MPEKGVFTEDFREGLRQGQWDLVVHSWKDLPIEPLAETEIVATLPRADARDVFLCKASSVQKKKEHLRIFSSSPRRIYNLEPLLTRLLPFPVADIDFLNVRGNILTRIRKLIEDDSIDGLVVAKAALDRLLTVTGDEYAEGQLELQEHLSHCHFQVLPLSQNPTAAAQGALAIEIKKDRDDLRTILRTVHCADTWDAASQERQVLKSHGGGCHQKIGVSVIKRPYGQLQILRGETESRQTLNSVQFSEKIELRNPCTQILRFFAREPRELQKDPSITGHFISRSGAVPEDVIFTEKDLLWASGVRTWEKLAARGLWVSGCSDGLGEESLQSMGPLCGQRRWARWTHSEAPATDDKVIWSTYDLRPIQPTQDFAHYDEYYWMSGSQFVRAVELEPKILGARHFCGPGHSYPKIQEVLKANNISQPPQPLPSYDIWLQAIEEWKQ
jgi:hydroxymethylbilane synthase